MKKWVVSVLCVLVLLLPTVSCSTIQLMLPGGKETATAVSLNTQAAVMTTEAYLHPSATSTPSLTPTPTVTSTRTLTPTITPTLTPTKPAYSARLVNIGAVGGSNAHVPNEGYTIAITYENTGTEPWGPGSAVVLTTNTGDHVTAATKTELGRIVKPGEMCQFSIWAYGSEDIDPQTMCFQLYADIGGMVEGGSACYTNYS